ncbi:MAG: flagellar biosynthesis protein FlgN [Treponema sp.]|nr:flagellar biosynthesis protein FlgN [Treponema sp.]
MELTQAEIDERTAILRRFRSLLEQQRDKFREYLRVLESQSKMIQEENTQSLLAHTELEQQIASHIISLQKVIKPMEFMYQERISKGQGDVADIPVLQADLERLQRQVLERNQSNRNLLKLHMSQIKERMSTVTNPYRHNKSVYAQSAQVASMVNISI